MHGKAGTLWQPEFHVVNEGGLGAIADAQRAFRWLSARAGADALLWPPCRAAQKTVCVREPGSSAVPAAPHLPGWIPSRSPELLNGEFHSWSGGILLGPAEEDDLCKSGAAWLWLCTLLCGDMRSRRRAGGEAPEIILEMSFWKLPVLAVPHGPPL
jgi:hypothetical protein